MKRQRVGGVPSGGWSSGALPKGKREKEKGRGKGGGGKIWESAMVSGAEPHPTLARGLAGYVPPRRPTGCGLPRERFYPCDGFLGIFFFLLPGRVLFKGSDARRLHEARGQWRGRAARGIAHPLRAGIPAAAAGATSGRYFTSTLARCSGITLWKNGTPECRRSAAFLRLGGRGGSPGPEPGKTGSPLLPPARRREPGPFHELPRRQRLPARPAGTSWPRVTSRRRSECSSARLSRVPINH